MRFVCLNRRKLVGWRSGMGTIEPLVSAETNSERLWHSEVSDASSHAGRSLSPRAQVDVPQEVPHLVGIVAPLHRVPVPKLPVAVGAPALDLRNFF